MGLAGGTQARLGCQWHAFALDHFFRRLHDLQRCAAIECAGKRSDWRDPRRDFRIEVGIVATGRMSAWFPTGLSAIINVADIDNVAYRIS